jgi:two-component system, cell cycle response regulator DivK
MMVNGSPRPLRVLIVDDYPVARRMFLLGLSHLGVEVLEADDVAGALATAREQKPDAVVVDLFLGHESGLDVARALRDGGESARPAIVALSGHAGQEHRDRAAQAGCDAYVLKPCDSEGLLAVIRGVLGGRGRHAQVSNL